jgi:hypothetical protein
MSSQIVENIKIKPNNVFSLINIDEDDNDAIII